MRQWLLPARGASFRSSGVSRARPGARRDQQATVSRVRGRAAGTWGAAGCSRAVPGRLPPLPAWRARGGTRGRVRRARAVQARAGWRGRGREAAAAAARSEAALRGRSPGGAARRSGRGGPSAPAQAAARLRFCAELPDAVRCCPRILSVVCRPLRWLLQTGQADTVLGNGQVHPSVTECLGSEGISADHLVQPTW